MAIDHALLESVKNGGPPVLRLYRWSPACLSFGRNQPARGRYAVAEAAALGLDFVRRPTGGQTVLHDDELTYAVIARVAELGKPKAAYVRINQALVAGLRRLGVEAALAEPGPRGRHTPGARGDVSGLATEAATAPDEAALEVATPGAADPGAEGPGAEGPGAVDPGDPARAARAWNAACFRRPERGEVVVDGAKLVGSAQRMEARTILQHGSILVGGTQAPAEALLLEAVAADAGPGPRRGTGWTTVEDQLERRADFGELAGEVAAGFREVLGVRFEPSSLTGPEVEAAEGLRGGYASDGWTWRR